MHPTPFHGPSPAQPLPRPRVVVDPRVPAWAAGAVVLVLLAGWATWVSPRFGYAFAVIDMPALALAAGLCATGLAFAVFVPWLIRETVGGRDASVQKTALQLMVAGGIAARLVLIPSEPMLEDDYQRYLWDGGVTAAGLNPYAVAPKQARLAPADSRLGARAADSAPVIERIGHAHLKTIYPPVAQAAFALAHTLKPWSLVAWKCVLLAFDLAILGLLLALLRDVERAPLWAALYWWNPLVLKELFNSGHMDAVVMALVLLALLLAVRRRPLAAVAAMGLAAGAKIWPVLLLPLLLRPLLSDWRRCGTALAVFAGLAALWVWPILVGGLDATSGFVAYAAKWQTNNAYFLPVSKGLSALLQGMGFPATSALDWGGKILRAALALTTGGLALWLAWKPIDQAADLLRRAGLIAAALVLLSPAQYPWYAIWFLPFLPFLPLRSFLILTVTLPLYYAFFHFNSRDDAEFYTHGLVWIVWVPAWIGLALDLRGDLRSGSACPSNPGASTPRAPAT